MQGWFGFQSLCLRPLSICPHCPGQQSARWFCRAFFSMHWRCRRPSRPGEPATGGATAAHQTLAFHQLDQKYIRNLVERCREQFSTAGSAAGAVAKR